VEEGGEVVRGRWFKSNHPDHFPPRKFICAVFCYTVIMSWAAKRRFIIMSIIGAVAMTFLSVLLTSVLYKTPSCSDGVQNQGEAGIDCGGPCPYLCTAQEQPPTILFTKTISNGAGRTDVVASIENSNPTAAAVSVPYTVMLYGAGQVLVQTVTGTVDLPPASIVPIFIPGVSSGKQKALQAFLTIDASAPQWFTWVGTAVVKPVVTSTTLSGSVSTPRIDAILTNASVTALSAVPVIVLIHDAQGNIIAASQTVVPLIPAQGQATATFTWQGAFSSTPAVIEVLPVMPIL
jgi:hypothetical protein